MATLGPGGGGWQGNYAFCDKAMTGALGDTAFEKLGGPFGGVFFCFFLIFMFIPFLGLQEELGFGNIFRFIPFLGFKRS